MSTETVIKIEGDAAGFEKAAQKAISLLQQLNTQTETNTKKSSAATSEMMKTFEMASIPFKKLGDTGSFSLKQLNVSAAETTGVYTQMGDAFKSSFGQMAKGIAVGSLVATGVQMAISGIKEFWTSSIQEFQQAEEEQSRLMQALKATGSASEGTSYQINTFADEIGRTTTFTSGAIVQQVALAKTLGASTSQSMTLTKAATELSATFGGDLEANTRLLAETLQGSVGRLGKLVPELNALTKEELEAGKAIDIVNGKLNGAAASAALTHKGQIEQMANAYDNFKEKVGGAITTLTTFQSVTATVTGWLGRMAQALEDIRIENEREKEGFKESAESLDQLARRYAEVTQEIEALEKKKGTLPGGLDNFDSAKLNKFNAELSQLGVTIDKVSEDVKKSGGFDVLEGKSGPVIDNTELQKKSNERKQILAEMYQTQVEMAAEQAEKDLIDRQTTAALNQDDLEQLIAIENDKIEARYQAEEAKTAMIEDEENRRLQIELLSQQKSLDQQTKGDELRKKNKDTASKNQVALDQKTADAQIGIANQAAGLVNAIAKQGSTEAFLFQKAVSVANVLVADGKARAMVPAQTSTIPYPLNLAAIAQMEGYITANTAISLGTIAAQAIKGAKDGALVTGGISGKDTEPFMLAKGEIVAPEKNFNEVVEGVARQRGFVQGDENAEIVDAIMSLKDTISQARPIVFEGDVLADESFISRLADLLAENSKFKNGPLAVR